VVAQVVAQGRKVGCASTS